MTISILNKFIAGFGHFEHLLSLIRSYLVSPVVTHSFHKIPSYPSAQFTGYMLVSLYPPSQASWFGHSMISVLFPSALQYPWFKLIILPAQLALSGQAKHSVAFQVTE